MKTVNSFNELIQVLGIKAGDNINLMTPQFDRTYDLEIKFTPKDKTEYLSLIDSAPKDILIKMGVGIWSNYPDEKYLKKGEIHYLLPGEWYEFIPEGIELVDISGEKFRFQNGISDDDIRFGCLPYGFIRKF
jgi:hypothetical protein